MNQNVNQNVDQPRIVNQRGVVNAQGRMNTFNQNLPPNVGGVPNVNVQANQAVRGVMMDRIMPSANIVCHAIVRPPIEGQDFELKPVMIQMLQMNQFGGYPLEDPNQHVENFMEICENFKRNGINDDTLRLRLFPISLTDKVKM